MVVPKLALIALASLTLTSPSWAAAPDFGHTDCASPAFKAFIRAHLGHGKLDGTDRLSPDRFNFGPIAKATTVARTPDSITCEISVNRQTPSGSFLIHGRFIATRTGWKWQPAY